MKITIANQKGGVGKSSISFLILSALLDAGKTVNLIDCDPQKSITEWARDHKLELNNDPDVTIVDTPPNLLNPESKAQIEESDKVLLVSTPTFSSLQVTKNSIEVFSKLSDNVQIVWNKVKSKQRLETRSISEYEEILGIKSYSQRISDRACLERVSLFGWNGLDKQSKYEIVALVMQILN